MQNATWVTEGARVAVLSGSYTSAVRFATVERITKTQIVLDHGGRYRVSDLRMVGESGYRGSTLCPPDDPQIVKILAEQRRSNAVYDVIGKAEALRNKDTAAQMELLDQLAAAVSCARDAVTTLQNLDR